MYTPEGLELTLGNDPVVEAVAPGLLRYRYPLTLVDRRKPTESGTCFDQVQFEAEGHSATATLVRTVRTQMQITPSIVHFGVVEAAGARVEREIVLSARDGAAFHVLGVESGTVDVSKMGSPEAGPARTHRLIFALEPSRLEPKRIQSGKVVVLTDLPGCAELSINWSVFRREVPAERPSGSEVQRTAQRSYP
jgi:hypothetical protein